MITCALCMKETYTASDAVSVKINMIELDIDGCRSNVLEVMISIKCNCFNVSRYRSEDLYVTVGQRRVVLDHGTSGLKMMLN
jgi:hypothetical protein